MSESKKTALQLQYVQLSLPFSVTITYELTPDPKELLATNLYVNTPLVDTFLVHIPKGFTSKIAASFSNSWYDVIDGLASAEQLKLILAPLHALLSMADEINCTFFGLSKRIADRLCQIL